MVFRQLGISGRKKKISVTCVVTHVLGHSEKVEAFAPADSSGAKNPIQGIKSTITYLKSVTLESILGLASTDANCDDDGNAASGKPEKIMTDAQKSALLDTMTDKGVSESNLCAFLKVESLEDLSEDLYNKAMRSLKNIKRKEQN